MQARLIILVFFIVMQTIADGIITINSNSLSRKKRYVAFPEGSSVTAAICLTVGMIGNPSKDYLSYAVNFGVAYNLPTADWARRHHEGFANTTKVLRQRRSRYDFYEKLILILDNMGFNGVSCVARALCESAKIFGNSERKRGGMIEEIVKTIFSYPSIQAVENEAKEHRYYDHIYGRAKRDNIACSTQYKECHISLLDLALGKYLTSIDQEHNDFKFM